MDNALTEELKETGMRMKIEEREEEEKEWAT